MASRKPRELEAVLVGRLVASPVQRATFALGAFTANTTVTPNVRWNVDRRLVVREAWVSGDAIPNDPDGTMLLNMLNKDVSEGADDSLVTSADLETLIVAAEKAYKLTLAAETSENEYTLDPGDVVRFTLVNNSAAITTNPNLFVTVLYQVLKNF